MDERNNFSGKYNSAKKLNRTNSLLQIIPLTSTANSGQLSYLCLGMFLTTGEFGHLLQMLQLISTFAKLSDAQRVIFLHDFFDLPAPNRVLYKLSPILTDSVTSFFLLRRGDATILTYQTGGCRQA